MVQVLNLETSRTDCEISGGETMLAAVEAEQYQRPSSLTHGPRFGVKWRENRRAWRLRGKPLKRLRFPGLESGWKVAGKWLATF